MSGRIRRLLRTVPMGGVDLGRVPELAMQAQDVPDEGAPLSPSGRLAQMLLAERLAGVAAERCLVLGPGRLVNAVTLPFACRSRPLREVLRAESDKERHDFGDLDCLVVGDALASEDDPPATLAGLLAGLAPAAAVRLIVVLPGTALLPDDLTDCPRRWLFSQASGESLARQALAGQAATVATRGNVLAASSDLLGLAADQLWPEELAAVDPQYPMVVMLEARVAAA